MIISSQMENVYITSCPVWFTSFSSQTEESVCIYIVMKSTRLHLHVNQDSQLHACLFDYDWSSLMSLQPPNKMNQIYSFYRINGQGVLNVHIQSSLRHICLPFCFVPSFLLL